LRVPCCVLALTLDFPLEWSRIGESLFERFFSSFLTRSTNFQTAFRLAVFPRSIFCLGWNFAPGPQDCDSHLSLPPPSYWQPPKSRLQVFFCDRFLRDFFSCRCLRYPPPFHRLLCFCVSMTYFSSAFLQSDRVITSGDAGCCVFDSVPFFTCCFRRSYDFPFF